MIEYGVLEGRTVVPTDDVHTAFAADRKPHKVGLTTVGDAEVSTVFLRMNHGWSDSRPLWFETMIFNGPHDGWQDRYETYDQAEAGHNRVVEALKAGRPPDSAGAEHASKNL